MSQNILMRDYRVLLHAESFGFGPSSIVAELFPHLRKMFNHLAFIGNGHALDLQRKLPYDNVFDEPKVSLADIISQYDAFVTVLDFGWAKIAQLAKVPTVFIDPLLWFWPVVPHRDLGRGVLYIAQAFYGVEERLHLNSANTKMVSPFVEPELRSVGADKILVNLGGLSNPWWQNNEDVMYAQCMVSTLRKLLGSDRDVIITSSERISASLPELKIRCLSRGEIKKVLKHTKYAFMTPGIGNILDAACYNVPTLFLPPANDSQGRQLLSLIEHESVDLYLDWYQIADNLACNYSDKQFDVLKKIGQNLRVFTSKQKSLFESELVGKIDQLQALNHSLTVRVIDRFGTGGIPATLNWISAYLQQSRSQAFE